MKGLRVNTKTGIIAFFAFLLITAGFWGARPVQAESASPIKVAVDTKWISFSVDPLIDGGTTLVQMRPLFESMGISLKWDQQKQIITGQKDSMSFTLKVDSSKAVLNGKEITLDKPARVIHGNTLVPLRFVGEATGSVVAWDAPNREITIFTEQMIKQLGLTKEQVEKIVAEHGWSGSGTAPDNNQQPTDPGQKPNQNGTQPPAGAVNLGKLQGMYAGFRTDVGGYECGGTCWDFYTFLPGKKVVVGEPEQGGPETIDCSKQSCNTYTIQSNKLVLNNGKTYSVRVSAQGNLIIDDVELTAVKPVAPGYKLNGGYVFRGFEGLAGANAASSAWEEWITFKADGTFKSDNLTLGTLDTGSASTNSGSGTSGSGTYSISGNTITLQFSGGKTFRYVFFAHAGKNGQPNPLNIQIGSRNFYVDNK
ncbi:hypothetical protein G8C92_12445 [Paenibacillus donghaensis]|uniref:copper amine oxidase N-terminal domain-containing protein n=1 Tax=Paenibacillus donghaensis TaxID=414771 RepID=UPI00188321F5|nr:copper amine oxidase N-terminal domain-containing protein [Paenibacillus donghaensis]MBE9914844.1 hypothetical protein [Paenibacillus donghaensis]